MKIASDRRLIHSLLVLVCACFSCFLAPHIISRRSRVEHAAFALVLPSRPPPPHLARPSRFIVGRHPFVFECVFACMILFSILLLIALRVHLQVLVLLVGVTYLFLALFLVVIVPALVFGLRLRLVRMSLVFGRCSCSPQSHPLRSRPSHSCYSFLLLFVSNATQRNVT